MTYLGTSGDTGSAAIDSVRGSKWVDLIVMLPKGRTAKIQELQMTTVIEDNIHVYRGRHGHNGSFTLSVRDCDCFLLVCHCLM